MTGINMLYESAGMHASLLGFCLESLLIDNDMLGSINRNVRGIEVNDETLSLEVIADVCMEGPGHYLGNAQTLALMQKEYIYPQVANRMSPKEWNEAGRPDLIERATARKREILPYLERLHDELDIPILYVSHAPDEVARLADHLVALDGGRVKASGPLGATLANIDLPIVLGEDVGVVLDATIGERDAQWHLARADFAGGALWARDHGLPVGRRVRVRVLARDVSLARHEHRDLSIQNAMPGIIDAIADDHHPALTLVRVRVGANIVIARLTKRSAHELGIGPGQPTWVQIKSVALME